MSGEKILVVDDDPRITESLVRGLDEYKVIPAYSAKECERILATHSDIDLIIMDDTLPDGNGISLTREIKSRDLGLGIILITANSSREAILEAWESSADGYLDKPFQFHKLKKKIRDILQKTYRIRNGHVKLKQKVTGIRELIERKAEEAIRLEKLSAQQGYNPRYLSRVFRENTGKSFTGYRLDAKMKKAKRLLETTTLSVYEISDLLSYRNPSSFFKLFKKKTGLTPAQYRKQKEKLYSLENK